MTVIALTWPEAFVAATAVAALGLVLSVLVWSIFRTGQTAITRDSGQRDLVAGLRGEVDLLRAQLERSPSASEPEMHG
jgi:hypothetical protein